MHVSAKPKQRPNRYACIDRSKVLRAGEAAALGLDVRCCWCVCSTGQHVAHKLCSKGKDAHAIANHD